MEVVLLGSGNVATHLGKALKRAGHSIKQVWSRDIHRARALAPYVDAQAINSLDQMETTADLYIIAVVDTAIPTLVEALPGDLSCVVHTSGSTDIAVFASKFPAYGVIYPLQTFSKQKKVDFQDIPIWIEGDRASTVSFLKAFAATLSERVSEASSQQRLILHIAAVFACNFSNYLFTIAERLLAENGLAFDVIRPLILETAVKAMQALPSTVQTGPAVRHDIITLEKHLRFLENQPDLHQLYQQLSVEIQKAKP